MIRTLWYFLKLALIVGAAIWLANRPGSVTLEWLGYRIDTSVGVVLLAAFIFGVLATVIYRFWSLIVRSPKALGGVFDRGRVKRGYKALTQGMVAVAAGDADEAARLANKATGLLRQPPLTLLLQAQAAQLQGDETAAKRYFESMLNNEETRFLGLRGLMTQSLREEDYPAALGYAKKAFNLRPKTPWLLEMLFDLSQREGDFEGAEKAVRAWTKTKAITAETGARKRAVLLVEKARRAEAENRSEDALRLARDADKLAAGFLPATLMHARLLVETKRQREAARVMERAWSAQPHPELVTLYKKAKPTTDPIEGLKNLGRLVEGWRGHEESRLALAEAALEAKLWGEARRYLNELIESRKGQPPGERACWLMARLEESEHGDAQKVREWLMRAGEAAPDPVWVCQSCGTVADSWSARCGACGSFDSLTWAEPPRVGAAALTVEGEAETTALPVPVSGAADGNGKAAASGEIVEATPAAPPATATPSGTPEQRQAGTG